METERRLKMLHKNDLALMQGCPMPLGVPTGLCNIGSLVTRHFDSWAMNDDDLSVKLDFLDDIAIIRHNGILRPEASWWSSSAGVEDYIEVILKLAADQRVSRTIFRATSIGGFEHRLEDLRLAVLEHKKTKRTCEEGEEDESCTD